MGEFTLIRRLPTTEELKRLREAAGWHNVDDEGIQLSLDKTLFAVVVEHKGEVVGLGRVIGDGGMYFYIQDVMVTPELQGRGIGRLIMDAIMGYISDHARRHAFIGLMSAKDKAGFYEKYGFKVRSQERPGMEIWWGRGR